MSEAKFKRFSGFQRVLHWLIAVPYVLLLVSGALIVLKHLGWVNTPPAHLVVSLHRWVGIAFAVIVVQLLLAALVGGHWKGVAHDFRIWLTIQSRDIRWLMCVPLNAIFPRWIHLPPAGRFNAGQKLHGLFILIAVSGFIVTGLAMILIPGQLNVWRVHVVLSVGAVAFLGLHLFLSLINPSTRRALGGIFTGHVSLTYVREHHALELDDLPAEHVPHATVSIKAVAFVAILVGAALAVWWQGPGRALVRATIVSPWKTNIILPGPLASSHSSNIAADDCVACHTNSGSPTKSACLACHGEIRKALEQSAGYHGKFTGDCSTCHQEHHGAGANLRPFDTRTFNHDLARFVLKGSHRVLGCEQCHVQHSPTAGQLRFIGVSFSSCEACHANPHIDMPSADCAHCHSEQNWTGRDLLFVHNRDSTFKLDAIHVALSCSSCHKQTGKVAVFRGTPTTCEQCHTEVADAMAGKIGSLVMKPDPHDGRVSCIECHQTDVRTQSPAQFAEQCARCHGDEYRLLFFDWQKSLDEHEQAARARLHQQTATAPQMTKKWTDLLDHAHSAGMHNVQQTIDVFETIGK